MHTGDLCFFTGASLFIVGLLVISLQDQIIKEFIC